MAKQQTSNSTDIKADINSDSFMSELQKSLQGAAGAVSSYDTDIEKGINQAIKSTQIATDAGTNRIESQFNREVGYAADIGKAKLTTANEARRGFATNTGILKQIYQDTDKQMKDLEQRKQELILQGEAEGASTIASLQVKSLEMRQQAQQKAYENMLSLASFGLSAKQEQRQARAQTFQEKQALGNIALEYGITLDANDTIESAVAKAAPFASQRQQLQLSKLTQDIAESRARTAQVLKEGNAVGASDDVIKNLAFGVAKGSISLDQLPKMSLSQTAIFSNAMTNARKDALTSEAQSTSYSNKDEFIQGAVKDGFSFAEAKDIADKNIVKKETKKTDWKGVARGFAGLFTPDF